MSMAMMHLSGHDVEDALAAMLVYTVQIYSLSWSVISRSHQLLRGQAAFIVEQGFYSILQIEESYYDLMKVTTMHVHQKPLPHAL